MMITRTVIWRELNGIHARGKRHRETPAQRSAQAEPGEQTLTSAQTFHHAQTAHTAANARRTSAHKDQGTARANTTHHRDMKSR